MIKHKIKPVIAAAVTVVGLVSMHGVNPKAALTKPETHFSPYALYNKAFLEFLQQLFSPKRRPEPKPTITPPHENIVKDDFIKYNFDTVAFLDKLVLLTAIAASKLFRRRKKARTATSK